MPAKEELAHLRQPPRLVYFSMASDPFLPAPRVLDDMYEIMATLLDWGAALPILSAVSDVMGSWFATPRTPSVPKSLLIWPPFLS